MGGQTGARAGGLVAVSVLTRICDSISHQNTDPQQRYAAVAAPRYSCEARTTAIADRPRWPSSTAHEERFPTRRHSSHKSRVSVGYKLKVLNFLQEQSTNCIDNTISIRGCSSYRQHRIDPPIDLFLGLPLTIRVECDHCRLS